jgi:hypothetical protein
MVALSMLMVAACAAPAGSLRSSSDSFAGPWSGVMVKGNLRAPASFRFKEDEHGYQGFYWAPTLTQVELTGLQLGSSVHFEVPEVGSFEGTVDGQTMQGTFHDQTGEGSFRLEKQPDPDDPLNVAF